MHEKKHASREKPPNNHTQILCNHNQNNAISHLRTISRSFHLQYSQKQWSKMSIHLFDALDYFFSRGMRETHGTKRTFWRNGTTWQPYYTRARERTHEGTDPKSYLACEHTIRRKKHNFARTKTTQQAIWASTPFWHRFRQLFLVLTLHQDGQPLAGNTSGRLTQVRCIATRTQTRWWQRKQDDTVSWNFWWIIIREMNSKNAAFVIHCWPLITHYYSSIRHARQF